jgi:ATP-binding cassette subfamily B protein
VSGSTGESRIRTFVRLLGFLRPYRWSLAASTLLAVLAQFAGMTIPWLTGKAIDGPIPERDGSGLALLVGLVVVFGTVKAVLMLFRRLLSGRQALGVEYDVRSALYAHLQRLSFGFFDRYPTGQLMSRATVDLQNVRFFLGYGLIFMTQHLVTVVGVVVLMLVIDWQLALVVLAVTPLLVAAAWRFSETSHPILRNVQQRLGEVTTVAEESIVGVNVVKSFAREPEVEAAFAGRVEALFAETVRATRNRALYMPLIGFLPLVAQATVLAYGGTRVVNGEISLGAFVAFNVYLLMLVLPLRLLGNWIGQTQRATASGERIFEVLDEEADVRDRPGACPLPPGNGTVRLEGVTFGYDPARPVLHDVDLEIPGGRVVALVGHTGSGKSTLTALVPRLYDAQAGRVLVDGADVRDVTLTSLRRAIGIVSQDPFLFSATVFENIAFGRPLATPAEVERAARLAQAHEFVTRLPDGYETVIGERGITLSGGQRQRLAIARALLVDPRILVLDDATSSVDARTEAEIRLALRRAMHGRTTIIVAHRLSTIALADEVVVLDEGRIVARGVHDEVLAHSDVYREIVEHGLLAGLAPEPERETLREAVG